MKKTFILLPIITLLAITLTAQDKKVEVAFHGFVKVDYFFDTRQTVAAREGHFLLFPKPADFDLNNVDVNAIPNFNILAVQTRLNASISGPDFYGAKSSAFIEGAFFGHSDSDVNGFRLRHAFAKLKWENTELLMGQYWHPMFVTSCFPEVYSFNTGVPFQPFSRNPQVRLTYGKDLKILGTFYSQRDFTSRGPNGTTSEYLRNSGIPAMNLQFQYASGIFFGGLGVDYKLLRPLIRYNNEKYEENLPGISYMAFMKIKKDKIQFKVEGTYGQNMADLLLLGGMAENISGNTIEFSNFKTLALWSELSTTIDHVELGLFGGYTKNTGIDLPLNGQYYSLGGNIDNIWRISARAAWKSGPTKLGIELERTDAQYAVLNQGETELDINGIDPVSNFRALVIAMYSF